MHGDFVAVMRVFCDGRVLSILLIGAPRPFKWCVRLFRWVLSEAVDGARVYKVGSRGRSMVILRSCCTIARAGWRELVDVNGGWGGGGVSTPTSCPPSVPFRVSELLRPPRRCHLTPAACRRPLSAAACLSLACWTRCGTALTVGSDNAGRHLPGETARRKGDSHYPILLHAEFSYFLLSLFCIVTGGDARVCVCVCVW